MNLLNRLRTLERRRPALVVGIITRQGGVDSLVTVAGEEMTRATFERRYAHQRHRLRIYELGEGEDA